MDAFLAGTPRLSATARIRAQQDGLEAPARGSGLAGMALASDMRQPGAIDGADVEPVKGIRKLIADRMLQSLQGILKDPVAPRRKTFSKRSIKVIL